MAADQTEDQEEWIFIKIALKAMNKDRKKKHDTRQGYSEWEEPVWRLVRKSRFEHFERLTQKTHCIQIWFPEVSYKITIFLLENINILPKKLLF